MNQICSQCRKQFDADAMVQFGEDWVCAGCKPMYVQRLKEQGRPPPSSATWKGVVTFFMGFLTPFLAVLALLALWLRRSVLGWAFAGAAVLVLLGLWIVLVCRRRPAE